MFENKSYFRIKGGPAGLRYMFTKFMPTIKFGTEYSAVLNASLSTNSNPQMQIIHMKRQKKRAADSPSNQYDDGLPLLFWKNEWEDSKYDVTEEVKSFYMKTPFPNYDDDETSVSLREKATKHVYVKLLDDQISYTGKILEVGCGTGQLSNLLAMTKTRTVFGADLSINSLKLANTFREKIRIRNLKFLQMNLFQPVFKAEMFDVVICNGVLHHTSDPFAGFQSISKLVKKGGFIIIGLYNKYGRIFTDIRRHIFSLTGNSLTSLDPRIGSKDFSPYKKHTWFMDQYKNPHESKKMYEM